jgi:hypothetical protein
MYPSYDSWAEHDMLNDGTCTMDLWYVLVRIFSIGLHAVLSVSAQ